MSLGLSLWLARRSSDRLVRLNAGRDIRRRLRKALELNRDLPAQRVTHVVVVKLDRLGRSAVDLLHTVEFLDSIGVVLHVVDLGGDSLSTQGAAGRLMFTVLAGMAEYE